jgi:VIT1/CCC1 family predicted Fe2+/Mn2+ transporter
LHSGTHSVNIIISGILIIAIADSFSDALGVHIAEESENNNSNKEIWESTFATLISKFVFALIFIIPFLILPLQQAIIFSITLGLVLISLFSYYLAKQQKIPAYLVIFEHLIITIAVIAITHLVGDWVSGFI